MGSSAKRKTNDRPVINRPKSSKGAGEGGASPTDAGSDDINNVCPLAFDVKLNDLLVLIGSKLKIDDQLLRTAEGSVVGKLTPLQYKMVQRCSAIGYVYHDIKVVDKKGIRYAEVKR